MFIKLRNYLDTIELYNRRLQDPSYGFANHVYDCHMTPVTRGALRYVSYQKGILQGHPGHRYAIRAALDLFSRIVFWAVLSIDISRQTVSYITCIFWWVISNDLKCVHVSHWLLCQTDESNTIFKPSSVIYIGAQVNSSAITNTCRLIQTLE